MEAHSQLNLKTNVHMADYLYKPLLQPMIITNVAQISGALFKIICKESEEAPYGPEGRSYREKNVNNL